MSKLQFQHPSSMQPWPKGYCFAKLFGLLMLSFGPISLLSWVFSFFQFCWFKNPFSTSLLEITSTWRSWDTYCGCVGKAKYKLNEWQKAKFTIPFRTMNEKLWKKFKISFCIHELQECSLVWHVFAKDYCSMGIHG